MWKIGDTDYGGNILKNQKGPVQLWEMQSGNYVVKLWVTDRDALHTRREHRKDADALFDNVCNMLQ